MRAERNIVINKPVEEVFALVTDMSSVTQWTPTREIKQVNGTAMGVGAQYWQIAEVMGQKVELTTEIIEYEPNKVFAFKAISGPAPLETRFLFTPINGSTRVELIGQGEPGNLAKLAGPLMGAMVKKQLDTQLSQLKRILEAR